MRFSSDQEIYNEQSQQKNHKQKKQCKQNHQSYQQNQNNKLQSSQNQPKTTKKQTLLSKFLSLIDADLITMMTQYQKSKRIIFQKQIKSFVPQKISLYEDVLIMSVFKQNQENIKKDQKMIKVLCTDLESRTKRKQCTIKERIQKKLCKLTLPQLKDHIKRGIDISFNSKKIVSSGSKNGNNSQKKIQIEQKNQNSDAKVEMMEIQRQPVIETKQQQPNHSSIQEQKTQISKNDRIQTQTLVVQQKKAQKINNQNSQNGQNSQNSQKKDVLIIQEQFYNHNEICSQKIFFKYTSNSQKIVIFQPQCIANELNVLIKQKQIKLQNQMKLQKLKSELNNINKVVSKNKLHNGSSEIKMLLQQAQLITQQIKKLSGQQSTAQILNQNQNIQIQIPLKKTAMEESNTCQKLQQSNSEYKQKQNKLEKVNTSNFEASQSNQVKNLSYQLCENKTYIGLFQSNPETFQPLLWSEQEDQILINIQNESQSKKSKTLIECLIRYKSIEWVIERFTFLKLKLNDNVYNIFMNFNPMCKELLKKYWQSNQGRKQEGQVSFASQVINV